MSISVSNNPDGTFTVRCGTDTVTVGTANATQTVSPSKKPGRPGGFVVTGITARAGLPEDTIPVNNTNDLIAKLKSRASMATRARAGGHQGTQEVHFSLKGRHTLDIGKLATATGGHDTSPLLAHIHFDSEHD